MSKHDYLHKLLYCSLFAHYHKISWKKHHSDIRIWKTYAPFEPKDTWNDLHNAIRRVSRFVKCMIEFSFQLLKIFWKKSVSLLNICWLFKASNQTPVNLIICAPFNKSIKQLHGHHKTWLAQFTLLDSCFATFLIFSWIYRFISIN